MNQIIAAVGFPAITVLFYGLGLAELKRALQHASFDEGRRKRIFNRVIFSLTGWAAFVSVWSLSGRMQDFTIFPLNMAPILFIPMITVLIVTFSSIGKEILAHVEPQFVIKLQSFRFFVELVIWLLFIEQLLPVQMTFEGRNFDVISGVTAPFIAWLLAIQKINRTLLVLWNLACLGLLINIVTVAILSMPTNLQYFFNEPHSIAVTQFPYAFLPAFLVPLAYMLHFLSLRQLTIGNLKPISAEPERSRG